MQQSAGSKKVKSAAAVKNTYTEQLSKLQQKHQQESDLLEDLRLFTKQRSIIEKEYAQALSKLAQQFLVKHSHHPPSSEDGTNKRQAGRTIFEVWQTVLEETDKVGKVRLQAAEIYMQQISEPCKPIRAAKNLVAKKVLEYLGESQKDITLSVQEVTKYQKIYKDEEHVAHDARSKAYDADDKVKKKSVGIFTSMSKLQQTSAKLNTRKEACELKSTAARNDYLLSLAAVNAHVQRYYGNDLPEVMKTLDCHVYERVQEYLMLFSQSELHSSGLTQECFMRILADSTKISHEYNLQCFLNENPVFRDIVKYTFQAQDNDNVTKVSKENQCTAALEAEAKRCAMISVQEENSIRRCNKKIQQLTEQSKNIKASDMPAEGQMSALDIQIKIEEIRQTLRKSQTEKTKAEARLESLKLGDINIEEFLEAANNEVVPVEEDDDILSPPSTTAIDTSQQQQQQQLRQKTSSTSSQDYSTPKATYSYTDQRQSYQEQEETVPSSPAWNSSFSTSTTTQGGAGTGGGGYGRQTSYTSNYDSSPATWDVGGTGAGSGAGGGGTGEGGNVFNYQDSVRSYDEPAVEAASGTLAYAAESLGMCTAMYAFEGTNSDELHLREGDQLELIERPTGNGWIQVRNMAGDIGLVPEGFVYIHDGTPATAAAPVAPSTEYQQGSWNQDYPPPPADITGYYQSTGDTANEWDATASEAAAEWAATEAAAYEQAAAELAAEESARAEAAAAAAATATAAAAAATATAAAAAEAANIRETAANEARAAIAAAQAAVSYSATDYEVQAALTSPSLPSDGTWARAVYDYYGTLDEELTFQEGQLIHVLRKELHDGVDDGWWEGEVNGRVGTFPSLVVEECAEDEQDDDSPVRAGPPPFAPPGLHVDAPQMEFTLPTPNENESPTPHDEDEIKAIEENASANADTYGDNAGCNTGVTQADIHQTPVC